jgi:hypothetical protein
MSKRIVEGFSKVAPKYRDTIIPGDDTIEQAIAKIEGISKVFDDKHLAFLANYLKANIEDVKDVYEDT